MFKPQMKVMMFMNLLPLSPENRSDMIENMKKMEVPLEGAIGGKVMGMMDLPGLSGGQRKKMLIAICVALAVEKKEKALDLDEPVDGINKESMPKVLEVLGQVGKAVPAIKFMVVTHDFFDLMPSSAKLLEVVDRGITVKDANYNENTLKTAIHVSFAFTESGAKRAPAPIVDWYIVKRHFMEGEFMLPLSSYIIFAILLGMAVNKYNGGLPGMGMDATFVFMKAFFLEYPHFGSVINYAYKGSQNAEDFFLNITEKRYGLLEMWIIWSSQSLVLYTIGYLVLCAIGDMWWVSVGNCLIDLLYMIVTAIAYQWLTVIQPNPIMAMMSVFPYVCVWGFYNGILIPQDYSPEGTHWINMLSPLYHMGCAYTHVDEKEFANIKSLVTCSDSIVPHLIFLNPFWWFRGLFLIKKLVGIAKTSKVHRSDSMVMETQTKGSSASAAL